jgi:hypothetical protein
MSFSMTTEAVRRHQKTVTRRLGWWTLRPGEVLQAVEKAQGLKKGEHVKPICLIRVISVRDEPLNAIRGHRAECFREGFLDLTPVAFLEMFIEHNKRDGVCETTIVNRIEFEYFEMPERGLLPTCRECGRPVPWNQVTEVGDEVKHRSVCPPRRRRVSAGNVR